MSKLPKVALSLLLASTPSLMRAASPDDRPVVLRIGRDVREERFQPPMAVAHVHFVQVTEQGEEIPGGEQRDATVLLYLDPTEADGQAPPPGLAVPDLRSLTLYLVANCAPQGSRCDTAQPSILLLSNTMSPAECPPQDGVD